MSFTGVGCRLQTCRWLTPQPFDSAFRAPLFCPPPFLFCWLAAHFQQVQFHNTAETRIISKGTYDSYINGLCVLDITLQRKLANCTAKMHYNSTIRTITNTGKAPAVCGPGVTLFFALLLLINSSCTARHAEPGFHHESGSSAHSWLCSSGTNG